jgi:hypothetical protein
MAGTSPAMTKQEETEALVECVIGLTSAPDGRGGG